MNLTLKFNLVLLAGLLVGMGIASMLSYSVLVEEARRDILSEATIMDAQADAISRYTADQIAPLLASQIGRRFLPQSIPAWAAQTNFRALQRQLPQYSYRAVVIDPTNPADLPSDWQRDVITRMQADSSLKRLVSERDTPTGRELSIAHPIIITDPACLTCHSTPAAAPASLTDLYGTHNGFNWKLNQVIGAHIVTVPMSVPLARAWGTFTTVLIGLAAVFLVIMVLLNVLLQVVIIRPARRIAASANEVSLGNMDAPECVVRGRDEIASLAESFNRMRRSLANAFKLLEE